MAVRKLTCLFLEYNSTRNAPELGRICLEEIGSGSKIIGRHRVRNNYMEKLLSTVVPVVPGLLSMYHATELKADLPKSNTTITGTPMVEWYVVTPGSQNGHQKRHGFKRDWTVCLKYAQHSRFNSKRGRRLDVHVRRVSE